MASPSEYWNSVVGQYLPQGHEKALKQAFYNTVANIFILLAAGAVVALYFVFSPFLRPLCWALLCGTFLYPFKRTLTDALRGWLKGLSSSGTPFIVGVIILPLQVVSSTSDALSNVIWNHLVVIITVLAGSLLLQLLYRFGPLHNVAYAALAVMNFIYDFLGYFSSLWVWSLFAAYIIVVAVYWKPESRRMLSLLAVPVWVAIVLHVASAAGCLRVPLLIIMVVLMVVGFVAEVKQARDQHKQGGSHQTSPTISAAYAIFGSQPESEPGGKKAQSEEDKQSIELILPKSTMSQVAQLETGPILSPVSVKSSLSDSSIHKSTVPITHAVKPNSLKILPSKAKGEEVSFSQQCFLGLLWAHVLVRLWMHFWLIIILLLVPLVHTGFRWIGGVKFVKDLWSQVWTKIHAWLEIRRDALAPRCVRGIGMLLMRGDRKMISVLESSLDNATSTLMILALLVGTCMFTLIGFVQVQRESMHIVTVTSNILNNTVQTNISQWLPDGDAMQDTMDSVVGQAYHYGRNFITSKVRELVGDQKDGNASQLEKQVLEVWDQIYDKWFSKNTTTKPTTLSLPDIGDVWAIWDMISKGQLFNLSSLVTFAQDNVGTFLSVLESVWAMIRGNMSLVLTILTSALSLVFGGGTAILNFVVSAAIFLTTLFYLLAFSGSQYKPVEFFSRISPSLGSSGSRHGNSDNRFGQAVEEAISGVFMASLKMAAFYGLYTWLVHLIFAMDIVFIPSATAAIFAAIPFVGAYWACLPAVVELWLVKGQGLAALACLIAHMVPAYVVDTAILREIKGSHPFMTGLAIAGGMICMGLEGAILGPILLCCLVVFINVYGNMLQGDSSTPGYRGSAPLKPGFKHASLDVKRSMSIDAVRCS